MNNTYIIRVDNIKKALDNIDGFETKFKIMKENNPKYRSHVLLFKEQKEWVIELNICDE